MCAFFYSGGKQPPLYIIFDQKFIYLLGDVFYVTSNKLKLIFCFTLQVILDFFNKKMSHFIYITNINVLKF